MSLFPWPVFRRYARDRRGNAALLFGFMLVPIMLAVGVAVDYGRALTVRGVMLDASDAAALAVGSWTGLSETELEERAQHFFNANYASTLSSGIDSTFNVKVVGDDIFVTTSASVPTTFMRLANINSLDVGTTNMITKRQRDVELALVLDTTGSMSRDGKIGALKNAAKSMVNDLFGSEAISDTLNIAVVPFAGAVNVGTDKRNEAWIDKNALSEVSYEDFEPGVKTFSLFDNLKTVRSSWRWQGCVRERSGISYELTDTPPGDEDLAPDSLFAPFLAPDEPDDGRFGTEDHSNGRFYGNSYLVDGPNGNECGFSDRNSHRRTPRNCQKYTGKYTNPERTFRGSGPNKNCPPRAITALSNNKSTVINAINALQPDGFTVIPAGLLWGWRVVSPGVPFTEGRDYDDEERVKAIVLLTDGENNVGSPNGNHNGSDYNAFGFAAKKHLGRTNGATAFRTLNAKTQTVCDAVKAKGILIYTIGFRVTDPDTLALLRSCATEVDMAYNSPSNGQLASIFSDIAQGLSELRIAN